MARNYAGQLPRDNSDGMMQEFPAPITAQARYAAENSSASSVITLGHNTVTLELAAVNGPAVVKWIPTTDTGASVISIAGTANFDHVIPKDTYRRFVVPRESTPTAYTSIQGVNRGEGLYRRVAIKSIGVASVLVAEFGQSNA